MAGLKKRLQHGATSFMNRMYRASGGRFMGKVRGLHVLLLTVPGRKTGVPRTTPVSYIEVDGRYVVTGSGGGSPVDPQWIRNLRHTDRAVIEVGPRRLDVAVAIAGPEEHAVLWAKLIERAPFFDKYRAKAEREIPMAILTPIQPTTL